MAPFRMLVLAALLALTQQQPQNGTVEIRVLDSLTQKGLPAVRVTLVYFPPEPPNDVRTLFTDAEGKVVARNLPLGNYVSRIERDGYRPAMRSGGGDGSAVSFAIGPERPNYTYEVTYVPLAAVFGRVEYPNGDPFPKASVALLAKTYQSGFATLSTVLGSDTRSEGETDDRGVFRLSGIPPGDYYIRIRNSETESLPRVIYHPGVTDSALAVPVTVRGNDISVEIQLPRHRVFKVSGTVISPAAMTSGAFALISANPDTLEEPFAPTYVDVVNPNEFRFEISGVSPGNYFLFPQANLRGAQITLEDRNLINKVPVRVVDEDIENLRITMQPSIDLNGKIIVDGDASAVRLESLKVATRVRERSPVLVVTRDIMGVPVSPTGTFVLDSLTPDARFALRVSGGLPPGAYVSDIRQGGRSVYAQGSIRSNSLDGAIEIHVDARGGTISGSVRDALNQPAKQTTVIVVPDAPRRANSLLYKRATTNAGGEFSLQGIPPGDYHLFAWTVTPPQGAEEDARFLLPYETRGVLARVTQGGKTDAQLRLLPQ